jgi:RimJ/RimL family protein N-acetyltransferase
VAVALRTPRLLLREWRDEDAAPFAEIWADPAVPEGDPLRRHVLYRLRR